MMGGALGLAVLASVAASRTDSLRADGHGTASALTGGYHVAFAVGAVFAITAVIVATVGLKSRSGERPELVPDAPDVDDPAVEPRRSELAANA